jgi:hypothetical protein
MKRMATAVFVLAGLLAATGALALDMHRRAPVGHPLLLTAPNSVNTVIGCDDNTFGSAYYQGTDDRLGNLFNFGSGSVLSAVGFYHYGFGFSGPYNYNLEIWDPASCTLVTAKNGLVAADAANAPVFDVVDTCPDQMYLTGNLAVMLDPNTCAAPSDCYPDLIFDDQINVTCPIIINNASTSPACYDVSTFNGPFMLRIDINDCATPTHKGSWGQLKSTYR